MAEWEASLAIRDGVFAQIALLTLLIYAVYRLVIAPRPLWRQVALSAGFLAFLALFIISVANILLWTA